MVYVNPLDIVKSIPSNEHWFVLYVNRFHHIFQKCYKVIKINLYWSLKLRAHAIKILVSHCSKNDKYVKTKYYLLLDAISSLHFTVIKGYKIVQF